MVRLHILCGYEVLCNVSTVSDFTPTFSTLEFSPGEDEKVVIVPITDDATLEDVEAFSATLISDKPNVIVNDSTSNADITIIDNDRELSSTSDKTIKYILLILSQV